MKQGRTSEGQCIAASDFEQARGCGGVYGALTLMEKNNSSNYLSPLPL
jgi:hypothetical protein